jgi:hypothetical protein
MFLQKGSGSPPLRHEWWSRVQSGAQLVVVLADVAAWLVSSDYRRAVTGFELLEQIAAN